MGKTVDVASPTSDGGMKSDLEFMREQGYELSEEEIALLEEAEKLDNPEEEDEEEDEEDEEDTEVEEDVEEEVEEEEEEKKEDIKIPKWRSDERVAKEREKYSQLENNYKAQEERTRWLEQQLTELIAQQKIPKKDLEVKETFDVGNAYKKYAELLIAGEDEEAARLMYQIDSEKEKYMNTRIEELEKRLLQKTEEKARKLTEEEKVDIVLKNAVSKYNFLDRSKEEYNEDLANDIDAMAQGFVARLKISLPDAYQRALDRLAEPLVKKVVSTEKPQTSIRKKAKAKKLASQPPETEGLKEAPEIDLDTIDLEKMTEKDWDKLSDADIAYLTKKFDSI